MKKRVGTRKRYMNDAAFGEFQGSLKEALAHAKGERADLRVTGLRLPVPLPAPPKPVSPSHVARIRQQMHISQSMFARFLNVTARTCRKASRHSSRTGSADGPEETRGRFPIKRASCFLTSKTGRNPRATNQGRSF